MRPGKRLRYREKAKDDGATPPLSKSVPLGERATVNSVSDALNWFSDAVKRAGGQIYMDTLCASIDGISFSTAFSGVGAVDVAFHCIECGLRKHHGRTPSIRNLFAMEMYRPSQLELQMLPNPPECLFADVCDVADPRIKDSLLDNCHRMGFDELRRVTSHPNFCHMAAPCLQHNRICTMKRGHVHVAGPPCVAWSSQGKRQGFSHTESSLAFLCWVSARRKLRETSILHENVADFPIEALRDSLGDIYVISTVVFNSADLGHACDRIRRLTWLFLKSEVAAPLQSWPQGVELFIRELNMSWRSYLIATQDDLALDLDWSRKRRQSAYNIYEAKEKPDPKADELRYRGLDTPWFRALTCLEQTFVMGYYNMRISGMPVCSAGQNPWKHTSHNRGSTKLATIIKNAHIQYSLDDGRWLTAEELLLAQAFPVKGLAGNGEWCSFSKPREGRHRTTMIGQCGNSMNVNAIGAALMWMFSNVELGKACQRTT